MFGGIDFSRKGKLGINYDPAEFKKNSVGDIVVLEHKKYKIVKKTSTAIALERWYWFDSLSAYIWRKLGSE